MDGTLDHQHLAEKLGPRWSRKTVGDVVTKLSEAGLLDGGKRRSQHFEAGRFRFVPPLTLQVTLLRPGRVLSSIAHATRHISTRVPLAVFGAIGIAGLILLLLPQTETVGVLGSPLPWQTYLAVLVAGIVGTTIHELAHGIALLHQGGRPSRLGVMLFYVAPAMFCDVSDAWRLPQPRQRVKVALAGIFVQFVMAGAAAVIAVSLPISDAIYAALIVFSVVTYIAGIVNLIPFVKFDGYIAMMSNFDHPNLRADALTDAKNFIIEHVFGGRRQERKLPEYGWAVGYGVACAIFPAVIVVTVLATFTNTVARLGLVGGIVLAVFGLYLVVLTAQGIIRLMREAKKRGARILRIAFVFGVTAAAIASALMWLPMRYTVPGGYMPNSEGGYFLVMEGVEMGENPPAGASVEILRSGILASQSIGSGELTSSDSEMVDAPVESLVPLEADPRITIPARGWPLSRTDSGGEIEHATAIVDLGTRPLGEWLYLTYVGPVFS